MNQSEHLERISKLKKQYKEKEAKFQCEFAHSNSSVLIDDIVWDHSTRIRVKKISWCSTSAFNKFPQCVYRGEKLRKDSAPFKSGELDVIYQNNMKGHEVQK